MTANKVDVAIVGAGVVGLAHAYIAARSGRKVAVFERNPSALGASIRNFGMIWPIGQPTGALHQTALRSRARASRKQRESGVTSRIAAFARTMLARPGQARS